MPRTRPQSHTVSDLHQPPEPRGCAKVNRPFLPLKCPTVIVLTSKSSIKIIHFLSAGLDHSLHHPIFRESSIPTTTSSGIHGPPIAEWTVMNWLVASRKYAYTYENQKKHHWSGVTEYVQDIHDQVGKKVGILGYGSIGRQSTYISQNVYFLLFWYLPLTTVNLEKSDESPPLWALAFTPTPHLHAPRPPPESTTAS